MRDEKLYLEDIAQCISKIEDYIASGKEAFLNTPMIQDAVTGRPYTCGNARIETIMGFPALSPYLFTDRDRYI